MLLTSRDTLRALIKQRGLTYARIGKAAECNPTMISALVNDHRQSCSDELAERIADALEVPVDVLFVPGPSASRGRSDNAKRKSAVA